MSSSAPSPPLSAKVSSASASMVGRTGKLIAIVTEADSPLGHAIVCRLLATNQWAKVLAVIRPAPPNSTPNPNSNASSVTASDPTVGNSIPGIRGNHLATHLQSLGALLVPNNSRPDLLRAFQAARALVLVPPASKDMPTQVARILDLVKQAGSPVFHQTPAKEAQGVRSIVLVSDVAAQFPTFEIAVDQQAGESHQIINVAKVYKETEEAMMNACKRGTAIVRAGVIMQDLLPLIEAGTQSTTVRFNAGLGPDSKFAPVNASDLAMGINVLAHCLATGGLHPAFAAQNHTPANLHANGPSAQGKGKGKGKPSDFNNRKAGARAPHGRIFLFTSPSFESLDTIRDHLNHILTPIMAKSDPPPALKPATSSAGLIHVVPNLTDSQLHAQITAIQLKSRPAGVRAFHTDKLVYHGALIRQGKLATARSNALERLVMRRPKTLGQVIADHGERFVPLRLRMNKVTIGARDQQAKQGDDGIGEPLEVSGIAAAGTEE